MAALDAKARREGHKAMEKSITPAARVRRRVRAGAPGPIPDEKLSTFDALYLLARDAGKARDIMQEEGLNPADMKCALVFYTPKREGGKWLPEPSQARGYFNEIDEIERQDGGIVFVGILWCQHDREAEAKGKPSFYTWFTRFMASRRAEKILTQFRDACASGGFEALKN